MKAIFCTAVLCSLLAAAAVSAQAPPRDAGLDAEGTGVISGVVTVDDESGAPLRYARVDLTTGSSFRARVVTTDEQGRFAFTRLPAGRFNLSAKKAGFLAANYGARRVGGAGVSIALEPGQHVRADVKLLRGGAISGMIRGPDGEPVSGVRVSLYQYDVTAGGERGLQLRTFSNSQNGQLMTDDRGVYRIYGLRTGDYYLAAAPNASLAGAVTSTAAVEWAQRLIASPNAAATAPPAPQSQAMSTVFFPGVTDYAAAAPIAVGAGKEVGNVDLTLNYVPTATISGAVTTPNGQAPSLAQLSLVRPGEPFGLGGGGHFIRPSPDGTFSASGVMPGEYKLAARGTEGAPASPPDPSLGTASMPLWALLDVNVVGQDIAGIDVRLAPGVVVSGRLVFEPGTQTPPADLTKVTLSLNPMQTSRVMSMGPGTARANSDGTFALTGVGPGLYRLIANLAPAGVPPNTWVARSSVVRGLDTLDDPIEIRDQSIGGATITFTDRPTQLAGSLLDAAGRPAPEYFVVVFSVDRKFWMPQSRRVRSVRPGTTGQFTLIGLPPGEYYVCALTDVENNRLSTPEYLEPLVPAGIKIVLADGEKKTQDLRVAPGVR